MTLVCSRLVPLESGFYTEGWLSVLDDIEMLIDADTATVIGCFLREQVLVKRIANPESDAPQ